MLLISTHTARTSNELAPRITCCRFQQSSVSGLVNVRTMPRTLKIQREATRMQQQAAYLVA